MHAGPKSPISQHAAETLRRARIACEAVWDVEPGAIYFVTPKHEARVAYIRVEQVEPGTRKIVIERVIRGWPA